MVKDCGSQSTWEKAQGCQAENGRRRRKRVAENQLLKRAHVGPLLSRLRVVALEPVGVGYRGALS